MDGRGILFHRIYTSGVAILQGIDFSASGDSTPIFALILKQLPH
jgi:hypothetical protein